MNIVKNKKIMFFGGVATAVIFAIFIYPSFAANEKSSSPQSTPVLVRTATATAESVPVQIQSLGTVLPFQTVAVKSRLDSVIAEVKFNDGDTVKAGDVLFVLDDRALKTQYDAAKADLARDTAQMSNLRKKYERNRNLSKDETMAISQEDLGDSKTLLDAQIATVQADKAALDNLEVQLTYTQITAPIDGRTGTINITAGNTVKSNDTTPLVTIHQIHPILVQMSLPQQYFDVVRASLVKGQTTVTAKRDQSQNTLTGKLTYIDNTIDATSGTFVARAVFENADESLWPGMLTNLSLDVGATDGVITIPSVAVQDSPSGKFVYVVTNDTVKKTLIDMDRIQNDMAIIKSGLNNGDQIVVDGLMSLKDAAPVKIAEDKK